MLDKLEQIEDRYESLTQELSSPELLADQAAYTKTVRQHRSLGDVVAKYREWKTANSELAGARELVQESDDAEMRELAQADSIRFDMARQLATLIQCTAFFRHAGADSIRFVGVSDSVCEEAHTSIHISTTQYTVVQL